MLDSKIWKIQSCEHIQVPGGSDKWGPTVCTFLKVEIMYCKESMPQCSKFDILKGMPVDLTYYSRSNSIESYYIWP